MRRASSIIARASRLSSVWLLPPSLAVASKRGFEIAPRSAQSRVDGVELDRQRVGNFRRSHLLQLGEHEHGTLAVFELLEQLIEQSQLFSMRRGLMGIEAVEAGTSSDNGSSGAGVWCAGAGWQCVWRC